jgi:DivIVA domain-containing protein
LIAQDVRYATFGKPPWGKRGYSKPPIGKRGYNADAVDEFLDALETTIACLDSRR